MSTFSIDPSKCQSFIDDDHKLCPRCLCCGIERVTCDECGGDGTVEAYGSDFDDDGDLVTCEACDGKGGYWLCGGRCDAQGKHEPKGGPR